jgi:hypothetical protein
MEMGISRRIEELIRFRLKRKPHFIVGSSQLCPALSSIIVLTDWGDL